MKYDKLIRDKIPAVIESKGKTCKYRVAEQEEYVEYLHKKLLEEAEEFKSEPNLQEAADLSEVIHSLFAAHGFTYAQVMTARVDKYNDRGGFVEKLILEEVSD